MKKFFCSAAIALTSLVMSDTAHAQFAYTLSKRTQAYTPLTAASSQSLTKKSLWTSDTFFTVPVGFTVKIAGAPVTSIHFEGGNFMATRMASVQSGFIMLGTGLMDRGTLQGVSKSDIRYSTTGNPGSRIFKLEVFNAGFEDEYDNYEELKDSVNMQLWLYEGSNILEIHYGSSLVNNFEDYFGDKIKSGYIKNIDTATGAFDKFYVLNGSAASPSLDSLSSIFDNKGLSSMPASGTVYRYTPKGGSSTGVQQLTAGTMAQIYPTVCSNELSIQRSGQGTVSYAIVSMNGQIMASGKAGIGRTGIDISTLAPGNYLVRVADEERAYEVHRIVKQ